MKLAKLSDILKGVQVPEIRSFFHIENKERFIRLFLPSYIE